MFLESHLRSKIKRSAELSEDNDVQWSISIQHILHRQPVIFSITFPADELLEAPSLHQTFSLPVWKSTGPPSTGLD